jgi:hypothetical protein
METKETISRGGIRPTFVTGGKQGDAIPRLSGALYVVRGVNGYDGVVRADGSLFTISQALDSNNNSWGRSGFYDTNKIDLDSARVVSTANEARPINLSKRLWRRVA